MNRLRKHYPALLLVIPFFVLTTQVADAFLDTVLWSLVTGLFGRMMVFGGWLLNIGINDYVIGFGSNFLTSGVGVAVDNLWVTVRDLFNLTFIFGLVYLGFKMILNSGDSQTKRWLIHLILAALLVNFSLFITKFVVDMSNILATQISSGFTTTTIVINGVSQTQVAVSDSFMDALGVQSTFTGNGQTLANAVAGNASPYGYIFGSAFLFIIGAFVFGAGGILLMIRYAVLMLYMILSPLMFLGWVFPGLQSVSTKYWKGFLSRAFFAPIYILMLYFANQILTGFFQGGTTASNFAQTFAGTGGSGPGAAVNTGISAFYSSFPPFIIACVFLIAALVIAQKMGADGASQAIKMGRSAAGRARKGVQRGAIGATKYGVKQTGGRAVRRGSSYLGNRTTEQIKRLQARGPNSTIGKIARTRLVDSAARGTASKLSGAKMGLKETYDQQEERKTLQKNKIETESNQNRNSKNSQTAYAAAAAVNDYDGMRSAKNAVGAEVKKMTNEQKLALSSNELKSEVVAAHLTDADIKMLRESGKHDNQQMDDLIKARDAGAIAEDMAALNDANASAAQLSTAFENLGKTINSFSPERIASMDQKYHTNPLIAKNYNDKTMDTLKESGKYDVATMDNVKKARDAGLTAVATGNYTSTPANAPAGSTSLVNSANTNTTSLVDPTDPTKGTLVESQQRNLMSGGTKKAGQMPVDVFTEPSMVQHLTPAILAERHNNGGVSPQQKAVIEKNILDYITDPSTPAGATNMWQKWSRNDNGIGSYYSF